MTADKFIGNVLKKEVSQHIMSTSNSINHKLWMKYLEKRLQILNFNVAMQDRQISYIFSLLQFDKGKLINKVYDKCMDEHKPHNMTQILGKICSSSKQGHQVVRNPCSFFPIHLKHLCLSLARKYTFDFFHYLVKCSKFHNKQKKYWGTFCCITPIHM